MSLSPSSIKVDHIGIAVEDLQRAIEAYTIIAGHAPHHLEEVQSQKVRTAFFKVGESQIELLEATSPDSPIAKFISKNGRGGVHHLCIEVSDIAQKMQELKDAGMQLIDPKPRLGAHQKLVAFIHPKSTNGVLIELSQTILA